MIFLVILIITITCTVGLLKINSKNEETPKLEEKDNYSSEEKKKNVDEIEEQLEKRNYTFKKYSCKKDGGFDILNNNINITKQYRYEFSFNEGVDDTVSIGYYYVDYIFNNLSDYNNTVALPVIFENKFYENQENKNILTKTQMYYNIVEYPDMKNGDFPAYLKYLENNKFNCTLIEKEQVINNYDEYYHSM